jgi:heme-degrading monooxygenase HmoA
MFLGWNDGKKQTAGRHTKPEHGSLNDTFMIVRISCDIVVEDEVEKYLDELFKSVMPLYSGASGLLSVSILQRRLVAYGEVATVSAWQSSDAMHKFFQSTLPPCTATRYTVIRRDPITYELVSRIVVTEEMGNPPDSKTK